ncbi:threonine/serine exporter ThrE family protein [Streptomyces californicus]|uniref:threonine/serine ThrE exporter family protein n=1 Tax=Streptomyces californicus TaxID=67351 RepID=UPI0038056C10
MRFRARRGAADRAPAPHQKTEVSKDALEFIERASVAQADAGVPSFHVTQRMQKVADALGVPGTRVYTMPAGVLVHHADGTTAFFDADNSTAGTGSLRMDQLQTLQSLLDSVAAGRTGAAEGLRRLTAMRDTPPLYGTAATLAGHALFGLGFGMLLKATWWGLVLAAALALIVGGLDNLVSRSRAGAALFPAVAAFAVTAVAAVAAPRIGMNPALAMIAPLVSLLPAAAMTYAVIDLSAGQAISGAARLAVSVQRMVLLAFGAYAASRLIPNASTYGGTALTWAPWLGVTVFCAGCLLTQSAPLRSLPALMLVAYSTFTVQFFATDLGGPILGGFAAGVATVIAAAAFDRLPDALPSYAAFVPVLWIVVPGALGLQGAVELGEPGDHLNAVTEIGIAGMVIVALAVGILFATLTTDIIRTLLHRPPILTTDPHGDAGQPPQEH